MKIQIKHQFTDKVLFEHKGRNNTIAKTLQKALECGADLTEADLSGEDLSGVDLSGSNLKGVEFMHARLSGAKFKNADLSGVNFTGADLTNANFYEANLTGANFMFSCLSGAIFLKATIKDANIEYADLSRIKYDFFGRMLMQKNEIPALLEKLIKGEIDGSCYEGKCCCFIGTIAKIKKKNYRYLPLRPDSKSNTERWFLGIKKGDTPENNQIAKITLEWIDEFLEL